MTVLRTQPPLIATKTFTWTTGRWIKKSYDNPKFFFYSEVWEMAGIDDLAEAVRVIAANPRNMIIRGALNEAARARIDANPNALVIRRKHMRRDRIKPDFIEVPRQWMMIDIDDFQLRACDDLVDDPEGAVAYAISEILPPCFQEVRAFWQLSSSAGFEPGILKAHVFYWLTAPLIDADLKQTLKQHAPRITDLSVYEGVQAHYVATPIIVGGHDPIPRRFGWVDGIEDAVCLPTLKPNEPRQPRAEGINTGLGSGNALARLGDGDGLNGFHEPLRSATMAYAGRVRRFGGRDDAAFITKCLAAIDAAPRTPNRNLSDYDENYLSRSIDGAFERLDGLEDAGDAPEPEPETCRRLPIGEARARLEQEVANFFADERKWTAAQEMMEVAPET